MNSYSNVHILKKGVFDIFKLLNISYNKVMDDFIRCEQEVSNAEVVKRVKEKILKDEEIFDLAELFKVFGDSTRMKIVNALMIEELCVCDIAEITNSTPSAISHQLRVLKQAKLVKYRKEGKSVFYSLDDDHVKEIFEKGREHIEEI